MVPTHLAASGLQWRAGSRPATSPAPASGAASFGACLLTAVRGYSSSVPRRGRQPSASPLLRPRRPCVPCPPVPSVFRSHACTSRSPCPGVIALPIEHSLLGDPPPSRTTLSLPLLCVCSLVWPYGAASAPCSADGGVPGALTRFLVGGCRWRDN